VDVEVLGKCVVTPDSIDGDAKDLGTIFFKLGESLVVESHLISANRAPIGGIKGEDDRPACEIAEGQALIRSDVQREVRGLRAGTK
jgi:hypothetical protein